MSRQLPPLNALRAFEAVARHLSFTKAAEELNVTRAAISHQIKYLEEYFGFALIERKKNRSILLTPRAESALPALSAGFDYLADAVHRMRGKRQAHNITVWATPSFAAKWLVPRLPHFSSQHPEIDMQICGDARLVGADQHSEQGRIDAIFRQQDVDVVIHFGSADYYAGYSGEKLFSVSAVPLCSPSLLQDSHPKPLLQPQDLTAHTLIHDDTDYVGHPSWARWLEWQGIEGVDTSRGLHFNQVALSMDAAVDGQGVLLSLKPLAQLEIEAGRLCIPFDLEMPLDSAYYVIRSHTPRDNTVAVDAFLEWLRTESQGVD